MKQVQAFRGILTLMVLFSHLLGCLPEPIRVGAVDLQNTPLHILWDGEAAVVAFFFISGYFFFEKRLDSFEMTMKNYVMWIVKRLWRLMPLAVVSLILCAGLRIVAIPYDSSLMSDWIAKFWKGNFSIYEFLRACTIISPGNTHLFNPPIWTLATEFKMIFVLPIILVLCRMLYSKIGEKYPYLDIVLEGIFYIMLLNTRWVGRCFMFFAGEIVVRHKAKLIDLVGKHPKTSGVMAIILLSIPNVFYESTKTHATLFFLVGWIILFVMIIKSEIRFIGERILIFVGDYSYSIYLFHFPVLLALRTVVRSEAWGYYILWFALTIVITTVVGVLAQKCDSWVKRKVENKINSLL